MSIENEKSELSQLLLIPTPKVSDEILNKLSKNPSITPLDRSDVDKLITDESLQREIGFTQLPSGGWLVAMVTEMPNVTGEMVDWWMWWHAQDKLRYQIWFPGDHLDISTDTRNTQYFSSPYTTFKPNIHYPVEKVGCRRLKLSIRFVEPEDFGFNADELPRNNIDTIVSGYVGVLKGRLEHTEMCHIYKKDGDGVILISRFWMGDKVHFLKIREHNPIVRLIQKIGKKWILNEEQAFDMAIHCSREYNRLAHILPEIFRKYKL